MNTGRVHSTDEAIRDEVIFYDVLHKFSRTVSRLNISALEGESKQNIEKRICRLIPAFTMLCGVDFESLKEKPKPKTVLQSNLVVRNGWGLCPKCGGRCIKVNKNTILVNHPAFCKKCKTESIVTWKSDG